MTEEVTPVKVYTDGRGHGGWFGSDGASDLVSLLIGGIIGAGIGGSAEFGTADNMLITPNREVVLRELQGIQGQAEAALKMVDRQKEVIAKCQGLIAELDPVAKEREAVELRMSALEKSNNEILKQVSELLNTLKTKE